MRDLTLKNNGRRESVKLYVKDKMYVPSEEKLKLFLLQQHHNLPTQGHPSYKAMFQKLLENWYWFEMPRNGKQYATNCSVCRRTKAYNTKKQGLLNPFPISNRKWLNLSLDFVVKLSECYCQNWVYCHILVVVDRLTKQKIYKPLESLSSSEFIEVMN